MIDVGTVYNFDYTGNIQTFIVPQTGIYKLEVWGSQGYSVAYGGGPGYGGYSVGSCLLSFGEILYVVVGGIGEGGSGTNVEYAGGYNGGGIAKTAADKSYGSAGGGGGATHIATKSGLLSTLENDVDKILIVAGGGAGNWYINNDYTTKTPGHGGGWIGGTGFGMAARPHTNPGGSQRFGYAFGTGNTQSFRESPGTGGGFYGGRITNWAAHAASGGSGYIGNHRLFDKHMTVLSTLGVPLSNDVSTKTIDCRDAKSAATSDFAKRGAGYARITFLGIEQNNSIFFPRKNRHIGSMISQKKILCNIENRKNPINNNFYVFPSCIPRLVAQYKFNGNGNDETGEFNAITSLYATRSMTYENVPNNFNISGKAVVLNGTSWFDIPPINEITGTRPRSIEMWRYVNSTQTTTYTTSVWRSLFSFGIAGNGNTFMCGCVTDSNLNIIDSTAYNIRFGEYIPDSWHHVVYTFPGGDDPADLKCYYDGEEQAQTLATGTFSFAAPPINFSIGCRQATTNNYFTGKLANLRIYNYELSAAEVLSHYQNEYAA